MSYCSNKWISDYTYSALYDALTPTTQANKTPRQVGDGILINGSAVSSGQSGSLTGAFTLENVELITTTNGSGDFRLVLVDAANTELESWSFDPAETSEETGDDPLRYFSLVLPYSAGINKIRLYYQGNLLDEITDSGASLQVNITSQIPTILPDTYTLSWNSTPDDLVHIIRYSADGGTTWQTLATNLEDMVYEIDTTQLSGTTSGIFQVIASSSVHSQKANTTSFQITSKAPSLAIHTPLDNSRFAIGETIYLQGSGHDLESGVLASSQLSWESDLDGQLGNGQMIAINTLSEGIHTITLKAIDGSGQSGQTQVKIEVSDSFRIYLPMITK